MFCLYDVDWRHQFNGNLWRDVLLFFQLEGICCSTFCLQIQVRGHAWPGHVTVCLGSPAKLLESGSYLFIQYFCLQMCIHNVICGCHLLYTFCTHVSTLSHLIHSQHDAVTVLNKCAANIHQAFLCLFWSLINLVQSFSFVVYCIYKIYSM